MARKDLPEVNAGSMADIAFLLLIFFLVTTTFDADTGLLRQLPPIEDVPEPETLIIIERNVYQVLANANNQLLVEGEIMDISKLREGAKKFMTNCGVFEDAYEDPDLPRKEWVRKADVEAGLASGADENRWRNFSYAIKFFGDFKVLPKSAVISLQNHKGTSFDTYIQVQNELTAAIRELRDELSKQYFNKPYDQLDQGTEKEEILAIRAVYPQRISEADPVDPS